MLLTPWRTSAPVTTTLGMFHVITACVLDQFMFVTNFAEKKSLQLHVGRGNYQQLKADKPCEHVHHRVTQGLIFTQSETAEIRLTFCNEISNPWMQVSYIHTSDWIHGYSELSAPTWRCHQMELEIVDQWSTRIPPLHRRGWHCSKSQGSHFESDIADNR